MFWENTVCSMDLEMYNKISVHKNFIFPVSILKKGKEKGWLFCLLKKNIRAMQTYGYI